MQCLDPDIFRSKILILGIRRASVSDPYSQNLYLDLSVDEPKLMSSRRSFQPSRENILLF
jgi:hypothetical protein